MQEYIWKKNVKQIWRFTACEMLCLTVFCLPLLRERADGSEAEVAVMTSSSRQRILCHRSPWQMVPVPPLSCTGHPWPITLSSCIPDNRTSYYGGSQASAAAPAVSLPSPDSWYQRLNHGQKGLWAESEGSCRGGQFFILGGGPKASFCEAMSSSSPFSPQLC